MRGGSGRPACLRLRRAAASERDVWIGSFFVGTSAACPVRGIAEMPAVAPDQVWDSDTNPTPIQRAILHTLSMVGATLNIAIQV
jgi:hypothetical protein